MTEFSDASASARRTAPPATYANPILDEDFPDPAVIRAANGLFYAYATQTRRGDRWINIQVARSPDLVTWEWLGDALPEGPVWSGDTQDFWAPFVMERGGRYVMFYSGTVAAAAGEPSRGHALAVAVADRPEGPFVDIGRPLLEGAGFEYIDPMVLEDPRDGACYLYWGSGFRPIRVQRLTDDLTDFAPGSIPVDVVWPNPEKDAFPRLVEAAWVIAREGQFYLFYSGDNCCGPDARYGVMVARADRPEGPYETLEQAKGVPCSLILEKNDRWLAPGHNCVVADAAGALWMIYHAIDVERPRQRQEDAINSRRVLLMDPIRWSDDGWPTVGTPSSEDQAAPVA